MKVFVTGGTGFIGRQVVRKLIERGYDVYVLARSEESAALCEMMGANVVKGDLEDLDALREGMRGSDVVFHIAAWYKVGSREWRKAEEINVGGTSRVLELAYELGVPRIIYTSTIAVNGDTHGVMADESYRMPADQPFLTEYDRTKWKAHYEVALPLIEKGAPITIVMPGVVYGPGDTSLAGKLMEAFHRGYFRLFPGPETVFTYAHVEDIAEGHILALEKGKPGESYILAGQAKTLKQMAELWAELGGGPKPFTFVPAGFLHVFAPLQQAVGEILPLPELLSADGIREMGATYLASSLKARELLGWETRPLEEGMHETFASMDASVPQKAPLSLNQARAAVFISLAGLFVIYLLWKKRKD